MTDMDVIRWLADELKKDAAFTDRTDNDYKAYQQGQMSGATRILAMLRKEHILTPTVAGDITYWHF